MWSWVRSVVLRGGGDKGEGTIRNMLVSTEDHVLNRMPASFPHSNPDVSELEWGIGRM